MAGLGGSRTVWFLLESVSSCQRVKVKRSSELPATLGFCWVAVPLRWDVCLQCVPIPTTACDPMLSFQAPPWVIRGPRNALASVTVLGSVGDCSASKP